jgi:hypothetical protein
VERTLIIFAREPTPGQTKTRLCPPLSYAEAATLYSCMLRDVVATVQTLAGVRTLIAYTPATAGPFFAAFAPGLEAIPQRGDDLGERMDRALREVLGPTKRGARLAVLIGSDLPTLPVAYLAEAFVQLEAGSDLVLGPADDGGYYLIGLRHPQPRLLREVPMSTPSVLADTLALADDEGLRVALLPTWYDLDTAADLRRLAAELAAAPPSVAPHTRAFLQCGEARSSR